MITLLDTFPQFPNDGDTVDLEGITFKFNLEKKYWTHDDFESGSMFDYETYPVHVTSVVLIKKSLMDEKDWWFKFRVSG